MKIYKYYNKNPLTPRLQRDKKNRGFAMVESLVAIAILVTSIIAPLTLAIQSAKYSRLALQRVQASYLADEGIELLVNYRKSLTQFCYANPSYLSYCEVSGDNTAEVASFNAFRSVMQSQITQGCHLSTSDTQSTLNRYCALDKKSFNYHEGDTTQFPTFTKYLPTLEVDKLYQIPDSIMTYDRNLNGAKQTVYSRVFYVQDVDSPIYAPPHPSAGTGQTLTVKIVSIACFGETTCTLSSKNKVVVQQYITR